MLRLFQLVDHGDGVVREADAALTPVKALERDGLVSRHVFATTPVTVEYALTSLGGTLVGALSPLIAWSEGRIGEVTAARTAFDAREPVGWS